MKTLFTRQMVIVFIVYFIADLFAIGMGMGVPIFPIIFGLGFGWLIPRFFSSEKIELVDVLRKCLYGAIFISLFTFLIMVILWGPTTTLLLNPNTNYLNIGIPMILYEPKASFIGWIVLMIVVSPFLQLLTMMFSSTIRVILIHMAGTKKQHK